MEGAALLGAHRDAAAHDGRPGTAARHRARASLRYTRRHFHHVGGGAHLSGWVADVWQEADDAGDSEVGAAAVARDARPRTRRWIVRRRGIELKRISGRSTD